MPRNTGRPVRGVPPCPSAGANPRPHLSRIAGAAGRRRQNLQYGAAAFAPDCDDAKEIAPGSRDTRKCDQEGSSPTGADDPLRGRLSHQRDPNALTALKPCSRNRDWVSILKKDAGSGGRSRYGGRGADREDGDGDEKPSHSHSIPERPALNRDTRALPLVESRLARGEKASKGPTPATVLGPSRLPSEHREVRRQTATRRRG